VTTFIVIVVVIVSDFVAGALFGRKLEGALRDKAKAALDNLEKHI
jgi:hypothetical protein